MAILIVITPEMMVSMAAMPVFAPPLARPARELT